MTANLNPNWMQALNRANDVRLPRAELKLQVKHGETLVRDVLLNPPDFVLSMRVLDLLSAQYRWSVLRAELVLSSSRISPGRRVGELTLRQRRVLAVRVDDEVRRYR